MYNYASRLCDPIYDHYIEEVVANGGRFEAHSPCIVDDIVQATLLERDTTQLKIRWNGAPIHGLQSDIKHSLV